ncbi:hypothetical protein H7J86_24650 [Mycobacterium hackensackense]|uniref:hypothetical protein n=1 Tax=Mycobacterium hackensackense TaxID=228909 RepID=UPI002265A998|nr:hypothetical protein [Mycobacterium hackensackense]MCV7255358.1 hypothetical protein [Mycobacterium hackensackense]
MPIVAKEDGWELPTALWERTRASQRFDPVRGVIPSGVVTVGAFSSTSQTYTNLATILWNSGQFNTQGQRWQGVDSTPSNGCRNVATPRTSGGTPINHVTAFEFLHTGGNLDIMMVGGAYYDCQVYVEYFGKMHKATAAPVTGSTTGVVYLPLTFAAAFHGRVRVHLGGATLIGIRTEQSSIVKKSPDRPFAILDGPKWADAAGLKQSSGTSYLTAGVADLYFERTGIVTAPRGMPSGFFYNGSATVTDDTAAADGSTRFFSASRKAILEQDFQEKPLFYILLGTLDDGGRSGANGASNGPMATRADDCYAWIRSKDTRVFIFHVSPPPFNGGGAAGTVTGPPTADSSNDFNRREQASAIADVENAAYLNLFGPTAPAFTGAGSLGSPTTSQQAMLIGADGQNPDINGNRWLAGYLAVESGKQIVDTLRARRIR